MTTPALKNSTFEVHIPNLDGDGIAEIVPIEVQSYIDPECGEEVLTPESLAKIEEVKARRLGLMLPNEMFDLRKRLDLTQDEICTLLQIGAKTFTRWETGRARPSRSMNVLLCALRDGAITVDYLRALREGRDWAPLAERRLGLHTLSAVHTSGESS
jgi:putative zinc finger/helix-turn-helix YgiT family protein